jgi:hypothetical protein
MTIKADTNLVIVPASPQDPHDLEATLGINDVVLNQSYVRDIAATYDLDPTKGFKLTESYRTIGDATQTQKTVSIVPGANMSFVESSDSTATDFKLQLNATSVIPPYTPITFSTDPATVTGVYNATKSGSIVNGLFTIHNAVLGEQEGEFQEKLAVSLRPRIPISWAYADDASHEYLRIDVDGTVTFRLMTLGSLIEATFMYFAQ